MQLLPILQQLINLKLLSPPDLPPPAPPSIQRVHDSNQSIQTTDSSSLIFTTKNTNPSKTGSFIFARDILIRGVWSKTFSFSSSSEAKDFVFGIGICDAKDASRFEYYHSDAYIPRPSDTIPQGSSLWYLSNGTICTGNELEELIHTEHSPSSLSLCDSVEVSVGMGRREARIRAFKQGAESYPSITVTFYDLPPLVMVGVCSFSVFSFFIFILSHILFLLYSHSSIFLRREKSIMILILEIFLFHAPHLTIVLSNKTSTSALTLPITNSIQRMYKLTLLYLLNPRKTPSLHRIYMYIQSLVCLLDARQRRFLSSLVISSSAQARITLSGNQHAFLSLLLTDGGNLHSKLLFPTSLRTSFISCLKS